MVTKKITKKLPNVHYKLQKTACRYLYLYRNGKRKKSDHQKKPPGISNHFSQFVMILLLGQLTTYKQSVNIFGPLVTFAKLALAIYLFVYPSDAS